MYFKINKIKKVVSLLIVIVLLSSCSGMKVNYDNSRLLSNLYVANDSTFADGTAKYIVVPNALEEQVVNNIGADGYFIASVNRFSSSFTKFHNPYKRLPMASLTKLMTALIVLENCPDLNKEYFVSTDAVDLERDVSKANLRAGDKLSIKDLLYGLLVPSGNDAAMCLAENVFGNYDNFIIAMNNEAERIGAVNTHFANPHGLDSDYHFTTAYDIFLITKELMKYDIFSEISTVKEYKSNITQSDGTVRTETWLTTNYFVTEELLMSSNVSLEGTKTGNTTNAGNCLVLVVSEKKSGVKYISVVLNAKSKRNSYYNSNALLSSIPQ